MGKLPDRLDQISDEQAFDLKTACQVFFSDEIKPKTLRGERDRGNLHLFRVGRKDFVLAGQIRAMIKEKNKCSVPQNRPDSGSTQPNEAGSSSTGANGPALAAMNEIAAALKSNCKPPSPVSPYSQKNR